MKSISFLAVALLFFCGCSIVVAATGQDTSNDGASKAGADNLEDSAARRPDASLFCDTNSVIDFAGLGEDNVTLKHPSATQCAWLMLYYDSTCGHCRSFAPEFVEESRRYLDTAVAQLGRQKEGESQVHNMNGGNAPENEGSATTGMPSSAIEKRQMPPLLIGAINCATDEAVCRKRGVQDVPTIVYHSPFSTSSSALSYNVSALDTFLPGGVTIAEEGWKLEVHKLLEDVVEHHDEAVKNRKASSTGGAVEEDWGTCLSIKTFLADEKKYEMVVRKQEERRVHEAMLRKKKEETERARQQHSHGHRNDHRHHPHRRHMNPFYDIAGAVFYTLWHEVPMVPQTASTREALKDFLHLISSALPGLNLEIIRDGNDEDPFRTPTEWKQLVWEAKIPFFSAAAAEEEILIEIGESTSSRMEATTSNTHRSAHHNNNIRFEDLPNHPLAALPHWKHCQGSSPGYRGFPCGLWTLYHTLVASVPVSPLLQAQDDNAKKTKIGSHSRFVALLAIRRYVRTFFFCADCRSHFSRFNFTFDRPQSPPPASTLAVADGDPSNDEDPAATTESPPPSFNPDDETILMLWRAHNNVNRRLRKSLSTDPMHPKDRPFPTVHQCPKCYRIKQQGSEEDNGRANTHQDGDEFRPFAEADLVKEYDIPPNLAAARPSTIFDEVEVLQFLKRDYSWSRWQQRHLQEEDEKLNEARKRKNEEKRREKEEMLAERQQNEDQQGQQQSDQRKEDQLPADDKQQDATSENSAPIEEQDHHKAKMGSGGGDEEDRDVPQQDRVAKEVVSEEDGETGEKMKSRQKRQQDVGTVDHQELPEVGGQQQQNKRNVKDAKKKKNTDAIWVDNADDELFMWYGIFFLATGAAMVLKKRQAGGGSSHSSSGATSPVAGGGCGGEVVAGGAKCGGDTVAISIGNGTGSIQSASTTSTVAAVAVGSSSVASTPAATTRGVQQRRGAAKVATD